MKVVFFGSGGVEAPVLETLEKNFDLSLVVRSKDIHSSSEILKLLDGSSAEVGVVANFGHIIPAEVLEFFPKGIINVHPSLLPKYRGPTPVQTAILNGDKTTGVTIIKIDEDIDHGPILEQKEVEILPVETSKHLLERLFKIGAEMLPNTISKYIKEEIKPSNQDDIKATFTQVLTKEAGFLDLESVPGKEKLDRMIKAFFPWPGVWFRTEINGKKVTIKLLPQNKIQVEGKNPQNFTDFKNGYKEGEEILKKLGYNTAATA
ncbi:MAG TPA: methionyl-tRNA formyltransferase [Patescibacteria group bacterium]|nr:methionyl-tRNA formyltransferase [Patescibacteria group bacterium]